MQDPTSPATDKISPIPWNRSQFAALLIITLFAVVTGQLESRSAHPRLFQLVYFIGFCGYAAWVWTCTRDSVGTGKSSAGLVLAVAILARVLIFWGEPSDDLHRYLWEGRIQSSGWNPYAVAPGDERLSDLRDENWSLISHRHLPTIYPPLSQLLFAAVARIHPSIGAIKILSFVFDVTAILALAGWLAAAGRPVVWTGIYALSPLVLTAFAMEGHVDSLMLTWIALAGWSAVVGRWYLTGLCAALAVLSKIMAVILLAWLVFHHWRATLLAVFVIVLGYLPYASAGPRLFATLVGFATGGFFNTLLAEQLSGLMENQTIHRLFGFIIATCAVWAGSRRWTMDRFGVHVFSLVLILAPVVHYWYVTWVLIFLAHHLQWRWIVLSGSMLFYFDALVSLLQIGEWRLPVKSRKLIWTPFVATWIAEALSTVTRGSTRDRT